MLGTDVKQIWAGLVEYANGPEIDEARLRETVIHCLPVPARLDDGFNFAAFHLGSNLAVKAAEYQEPMKRLLVALCKGSLVWEPDENSPLRFLQTHLGHVKLQLDSAPPEPDRYGNYEGSDQYYSKKTGQFKKSPLRRFAMSMSGQDPIDPLIQFIIEECERVRQRAAPFPIVVCDYCGKLSFPKRRKTGKNERHFCSGADCKDAFYRQDSKPQTTAEAFLRRWGKVAKQRPSTIRSKFSKPNFRQKYEAHKALARARSAKHIQAVEKALQG